MRVTLLEGASRKAKIDAAPAHVSSIADNFSLICGGPFYRALHRTGPFEAKRRVRRTLIWLAVTWLPLLALCIMGGTAWGHKVRIPLLEDFSIYGRFLVALPLLIAAESIIDPFLRRAVATLNTSGIIREDSLPQYHATLERIASLRDSRIVELVLIFLSFVPYFLLVDDYSWGVNGVSVWHGTASYGFTAAGWWFISVSSPVPRFFMLRWLWRYGLWICLLRRVSQLDLRLLATHPDRHGGLGFLLLAHQQFGILAAALGSVLGGQFANEMIHFGEKFTAIKGPVAVFIVLSVVITLTPLAMFSLKLFEARRDGLVRYSIVARGLTGAFDAKWIRKQGPPPEAMMGTQDPSSLIDYISSYDVIQQTQIVPITKRAIIFVAAQAAAPFALVWFLATPSERLISEIIKRLL